MFVKSNHHPPDEVVKSNHHPPDEVVEHRIVFILPHTIVCMQVDMCLYQAMLLKEMVEETDDDVCPLPCFTGFINEVVELP